MHFEETVICEEVGYSTRVTVVDKLYRSSDLAHAFFDGASTTR